MSLSSLELPPAGVQLTPANQTASGGSRQVLHVRFSETALADLIASAKSDSKSLSLQLGSSPGINIGASGFHPITLLSEAALVDVYTYRRGGQSSGTSDPKFELVGSVSHRATVENKTIEDASVKLKSQHEAALREKEAMRTTLIDPIHRPGSRHAQKAISTPSPRLAPSSPHLSAIGGSSLLKSRPALAPSSPKASNLMRSLQMRTLHLLAVEQPCTVDSIVKRTKSSADEVKVLLKEFATPFGAEAGENTKYELLDPAYKELKVWEWRAYGPSERESVISRATEAFNRLGVSKEDPLRMGLVEPRLRTSPGEKIDDVARPNQADLIVPALKLNDTPLPAAIMPEPSSTTERDFVADSQSNRVAQGTKRVGGGLLTSSAKKPKTSRDGNSSPLMSSSQSAADDTKYKPDKSAKAQRSQSPATTTARSNSKPNGLLIRHPKEAPSSKADAKEKRPSSSKDDSGSLSVSSRTARVSPSLGASVKPVKRPAAEGNFDSDKTSPSQLGKHNDRDDSNDRAAKKRKVAPPQPAESRDRSRSPSSSSSGDKSPRKPSPLGTVSPVSAASLASESRRATSVASAKDANAEKTELLKLAIRFKSSYEEYRTLFAEVRQYEKDAEEKRTALKIPRSGSGTSMAYETKKEKLLQLHNKLVSWKTRLWREAPRFSS
ncbi:uncharacterized protein V1518DRAFT_410495 [Limtongia smithiae]|uniref:uncharacterized protein n=1 Tax=Limtongia smithiae TaxID=1125753 RepID=UPI0034CE34F8